jgi:hypothetical protein
MVNIQAEIPMTTFNATHTSEPKYRLTIGLASSAAGTLVSWSQTFENSELATKIEPIVVPANDQNLERLAADVLRSINP